MPNSVVVMGNESPDWVALAALFVSVISAIFTVAWSFRTERRSYIDGYWFREVTAPSCIEPAIFIREMWCKRLESLGNTTLALGPMQSLLGELQRDIDKAIDKAWIAKLFKGDLYEFIAQRMEEINDTIVSDVSHHVQLGRPIPAAVAVDLSDKVAEEVLSILKRAAATNSTNLKINNG